MKDFEYNYDGHKLVIGHVSGASSTLKFHIMLDNFYHGEIWNTEHYGWQYWLQDDSPITGEEIESVIEDIKKATDEGG